MAQRVRSISVVCALLLAMKTVWTTHISTSVVMIGTLGGKPWIRHLSPRVVQNNIRTNLIAL